MSKPYIFAKLPVPPSANELFANRRNGGGRIKTKAYRDWTEEAGYHLRIAWANLGKPEFGNAPMRLTITAGIGRHRDLSNCCKAIEDLVVSLLPVPDDRWNDEVTLRRSREVDGVATVLLEPISTA